MLRNAKQIWFIFFIVEFIVDLALLSIEVIDKVIYFFFDFDGDIVVQCYVVFRLESKTSSQTKGEKGKK